MIITVSLLVMDLMKAAANLENVKLSCMDDGKRAARIQTKIPDVADMMLTTDG